MTQPGSVGRETISVARNVHGVWGEQLNTASTRSKDEPRYLFITFHQCQHLYHRAGESAQWPAAPPGAHLHPHPLGQYAQGQAGRGHRRTDPTTALNPMR